VSVVKLSQFGAGKTAQLLGFLGAALVALECAQGADVSSSQNGGTRGTGGSVFAGSGGSSGTSFVGAGGSTSTNAGGSTGLGGSTAAGGSSNTGGSVFVGAGGIIGAGGAGGGAGFLGLGGSAPTDSGSTGTGGGGSDFDGPVSMGLQAAFHATQTNGLAFNIEITNTGLDTPAINTIKVRYYFSDEGFSDASSIIFDYAAWNGPAAPYNLTIGSACTATLTLLTVTNPAATSYYEFTCDSTATISTTDKVTIQVRSTTSGEDPTNDYSYILGDGGQGTVPDSKLLIYQGATLVWGTPP
jgi:hypothetical protein